MDIEAIYKQIIRADYKYCKVFQNGYQKLLLSSSNGEQKSAEEIVKELKNYFNDFPGTYRLQFKRKPTDKDISAVVYDKIRVNDFDATVQEVEKNHSTPSDLKKLTETIKKQLLTEMVAEKKKNDLENCLKEQKKKTDELDTIAGKAVYLLTAIMGGIQQPTGQLGKSSTQNLSIMDSKAKDINTFTEIDKQRSNEALMRFLSVTNPDFLLEMAKKVQEKPELINTLKQFI